MPELAEVEYVVRQMRTSIVGAEFAAVTVLWQKSISHPDVATFIHELIGRQIAQIDRRAKLVIFRLADGDALTVHRRMSGNLMLREAGQPDLPYLCVEFTFTDGRRVQYTDPRKFGRLALWSAADLPTVLAAYGVEPLSVDFTVARLTQLMHTHHRAMKPLLLDQSVIAGLGNIYVDEALLQAKIHPARQSDTLTPDEITRLRTAIIAVLELGIAHGGTSFGRHQDFFGVAGSNFSHVKAYKQEGKPCPTCGTPIRRIVVGQRGTRICPHCQPEPS
jgi:formamidopyrimidine-DNA glycosylase